MAVEFGSKIHFVHLRNVVCEDNGSFYEAQHLDSDNDMVGLIDALLDEEKRREKIHGIAMPISMRLDHGHLLDREGKRDSLMLSLVIPTLGV